MRNQTDILLLKIADGISDLVKNPDLKKKISEAYKFNDEEQKRYVGAQKFMAEVEVIKKEIEAQKAVLDSADERLAKASEAEKSNALVAAELDAERKAIKKEAKSLEEKENVLNDFEKQLSAKEAAISLGEEALKKKEEELKEYEATLRAAAARSQAALAGL